MKLTKGFKKVAAVSLLCSFGAAANAVPLITSWNVDQEFEWTAFTENTGTTGTGVKGLGGDPERVDSSGVWGNNVDGSQLLRWSDNAGLTSGIRINNLNGATVNSSVNTSTDGVLDFNVDFGLGPIISHNNTSIAGTATTLDTAEATDFIVLNATVPALGPLPPRSLTYDVDFFESPNSATGAACPQGNPGNGCRDVFTISGPGLAGAFVDVLNTDADALAIDSFLLPGDNGNFIKYTVYLLADGLGLLSDAVCAIAGASSGCFGLITDEGSITSFQLYFAITAEEIPEPAILLLMALGLLGLALARRKNSANL